MGKFMRGGPVQVWQASAVDVLEEFTSAPPDVLEEMRDMKKKLRWIDFFQRLLRKNIIRYSCLDVVYLGAAFTKMTQHMNQTEVAQIVHASTYRGPYGRGDCYRPPTRNQIRRKEEKGITWNEERREWV